MQTKQRLELIEQECQIRNNLKKIPFTHYFSNHFMEKYTQFFCIEDFFESLGVTDETALNQLSIDLWEQQVRSATIFSTWQEMLDKAGEEYAIENFY